MPTRSRLRRLAACVLLVWLFAHAAGIANACVLGGELRQRSPAAVHQMHDGYRVPAEHGAGEDAVHQHRSDRKPPCERLCDAPAARLADRDPGCLAAGPCLAPAPPPSFDVRIAAGGGAAFGAAEPPWRTTVPLPIAYQRLML